MKLYLEVAEADLRICEHNNTILIRVNCALRKKEKSPQNNLRDDGGPAEQIVNTVRKIKKK